MRIAAMASGSQADVDAAVASARRAFEHGAWRKAGPATRQKVLHDWADLVAKNADRLDALDALEMGKPTSLKRFNALGSAGRIRYFSEALDKLFGEVSPSGPSMSIMRRGVPRGVVAAIVPWNFPTANVAVKAAPALAAGNSLVLKPSELASQSAVFLARLALEAGLPPGVFNVVPGKGDVVGRALALHDDVDMLTFTGSSQVGKLMLQYAGQSNLKTVIAECGGKSPQIVFDDGVDLEQAADSIASMILLNSGQWCSAGSRLLVQRQIAEQLTTKVARRFAASVLGSPMAADTTFGPLASRAQMSRVLSYVEGSVREGAHIHTGGKRVLEESGGFFVEPTILTHVHEMSAVAQEEVFGSVLAVMPFDNESDAIRLANGTPYGLAAYVWTASLSTAFRMSNEVQAGTVVVNAAASSGDGPGYAASVEPYGLSGTGIEGGLAGLRTYQRQHQTWFNI